MCGSVDRTVFDVPFTWDRIRFESTRAQCRLARKLVEASINVQFEKQFRSAFTRNVEIEENIVESNERLLKYYDKLRVLDNMVELASQSLINYFETRMENVRAIVNEHCSAIQQVIREEAEHWKEIHAVMDQNLLNPGDIRTRNNFPRTVQKSPSSNIQAIDEANEEEEERTSKLLDASTLTPLLTQMIRKSRLQSKTRFTVPSPSQIEIEVPSSSNAKSLNLNKQERFSVALSLSTVRQPLHIVDTTFVVKLEDPVDVEINIDQEPNGTYRATIAPDIQRSHTARVESESSPLHSQPNIPARLCFSPTILQDDDERLSPSVNTVLSPIDQNRTNADIEKKNAAIRRFGQTFLLDIVKTEEISDDGRGNDADDEYMRPNISDDDEIPVIVEIIPPSLLPQFPCVSNDPDSPTQKSSLSKTRSTRATTKSKPKPALIISRKTRSATKDAIDLLAKTIPVEEPIVNNAQKRKTRKRKQSKSIDRDRETSDEESSADVVNTKRTTRKRKQSKSVEHQEEPLNDENERPPTASSTVNSKRKKKTSSVDNEEKKSKAKTKKGTSTTTEGNTATRKTRKRKPKKKKQNDNNDEEEILVPESSPIRAIDRSKHYSTRFSSKRDRRQT